MAETVLGLRAKLKGLLGNYEPLPFRQPALLGNSAGTVEVVNRPGYVYVRNTDGSPLGEALNQTVPNSADLPVIVGYTHINPTLLQVLGCREVYIGTTWQPPNPLTYIPKHHWTHELKNPDGGGDVVWVRQQQIVPFLVAPQSPETMYVDVRSGLYYVRNVAVWFPETTSGDLTAYIPASNYVIYVLISLNMATEALAYTAGTAFADQEEKALDDALPSTIPGGHMPLAAVKLLSTTTSIGWDEIYDVRPIIVDWRGTIAHAVGQIEAEMDMRFDLWLHTIAPRLISHAAGQVQAELDMALTNHYRGYIGG